MEEDQRDISFVKTAAEGNEKRKPSKKTYAPEPLNAGRKEARGEKADEKANEKQDYPTAQTAHNTARYTKRKINTRLASEAQLAKDQMTRDVLGRGERRR